MPRRLEHPISDRHSNVSVATSRARPWATNGDAVHQPVRSCFSSKPPYHDGTTHLVMPHWNFATIGRARPASPAPSHSLPCRTRPNAALRSQIVPTDPDQANDAKDPPLGLTTGSGPGLAIMHLSSRDHLS